MDILSTFQQLNKRNIAPRGTLKPGTSPENEEGMANKRNIYRITGGKKPRGMKKESISASQLDAELRRRTGG